MNRVVDKLKPGQRIRVVQQIDRREGSWTTEIVGRVVEVVNAPTGSWYAHGPSDRYLLKRIRLQKDDGEMTLLSLDGASRVYLEDDCVTPTAAV